MPLDYKLGRESLFHGFKHKGFMAGVSVCSSAPADITVTDWVIFEQEKYILLTILKVGKSKIKVPVHSVACKSLSSASKRVCFCCILRCSQGKEELSIYFIVALIPWSLYDLKHKRASLYILRGFDLCILMNVIIQITAESFCYSFTCQAWRCILYNILEKSREYTSLNWHIQRSPHLVSDFTKSLNYCKEFFRKQLLFQTKAQFIL